MCMYVYLVLDTIICLYVYKSNSVIQMYSDYLCMYLCQIHIYYLVNIKNC